MQVRLCDVESVDMLDKRGYLTVCLTLGKSSSSSGGGGSSNHLSSSSSSSTADGGKIYLRKADGIRDWHSSIQVHLHYTIYIKSSIIFFLVLLFQVEKIFLKNNFFHAVIVFDVFI